MNKDHIQYLEQSELSCLDIEKLVDAYVDDELHPLIRARFEDHFAQCDRCAFVVQETKHLIEVARSLDEKPLPQGIRKRLRKNLLDKIGHRVLL